jgi:uncharacterized membrane protein
VFAKVDAELILIGAICQWCGAIHLVGMALFLLAIGDTFVEPPESAA